MRSNDDDNDSEGTDSCVANLDEAVSSRFDEDDTGVEADKRDPFDADEGKSLLLAGDGFDCPCAEESSPNRPISFNFAISMP